MVTAWAWRECMAGRMEVPDAVLITAAMFVVVVAFVSMAWYLIGANRMSIKLAVTDWLNTMMFRAEAWMQQQDREDDPIMPTDYVSWASAKLWRDSCIKPEERRLFK